MTVTDTFADIVLIVQCLYYRGFTFRNLTGRKDVADTLDAASERSPLLANGNQNGSQSATERNALPRITSQDRFASLDGSHHLSPATPMHPQRKDAENAAALKPSKPRTWTQAILFNSTAIILVVLAGIAGYFLSPSAPERRNGKTPADEQTASLHFSLWGQIFGYICAALYLSSRMPQILLNYQRKSTEGLNALFFIFACIGNLTFVCSILAFSPLCSKHYRGHWHESTCKEGEAAAIYWRYFMVNLSWLIGSAGTLGLDFAVFVQFFLYRNNVEGSEQAVESASEISPDVGRPHVTT